MARAPLIGSRIRERRTVLEMRQAELARRAGISASYLNLIEHNRRRIGGGLLNAIARALNTEPSALTDGAEAGLLDALREAADGHGPAEAELPRIEEFVGRFPGWAALLSDTARQLGDLRRLAETLADRMTHDPHLSAALHEVLSTATSIRSTATILVEEQDIAPEWNARFHRNLQEDSERLAQSAGALVHYLDESAGAEVARQTPLEELDAFLAETAFHVADLERALPLEPERLVQGAKTLTSEAARSLAVAHLERYQRDASRMPLAEFARAAKEERYDPAALARTFGVDLSAVFRRLASLSANEVAAPIGLVTCDASGALTFRKPLEGFALPRYSAACPLWPLYQALLRPMAPLRHVVDVAGRSPQRFVTYALCQPKQPSGFGGPEIVEASMLIVPTSLVDEDGDAAPELEIGMACRVCPRGTCPARHEPSILADVV